MYDSRVVTVKPALVVDIESDKNNISLNQNLCAGLYLKNTNDVKAVAVKIKYDTDNLKYQGLDVMRDIRILREKVSNGEIQLLILNIDNTIKSKNELLKLNFISVGQGTSVIEIYDGSISNLNNLKRDLKQSECGQATIFIKE